MTKNIGYTKDLYVMPFDHRGSFQEKLFGIKGTPTAEQTAEIASYKDVIYEGFKRAIKAGVPADKAGILADEQFGANVLKNAKADGYTIACPAEKSGQDEFDFEYGAEFGAHINKFDVNFVKVLVRYNPEGDAVGNKRQLERLKQLSDYCHSNNRKFMFELLVPATTAQLAKVGGVSAQYDLTLRPSLMVQAMQQIQDFGVEPDLWKLEGVETTEAVTAVAKQAKNAPHRADVGVILLGRGENAEKVGKWLTVAAAEKNMVGFAVGRTIFWEPLKGLKAGQWDKNTAADMVAKNFKGFCDLWISARKKAGWL